MSRCRRHLRESPASEYERTIVPRSPDVQALPRERQQVTIWSTRKMARPRAYTDRQDARKMSTTFLGGDDGMARPPSSSSSSSSSPTSSSSSSVAVADDGSVGAILYIGEASEIFELSRNSARTLQELSRNFPGTFQELFKNLFRNFPGTYQEVIFSIVA